MPRTTGPSIFLTKRESGAVKMQARTLLRELQAKAHHQAGYAVASVYLGLRFRYVTLQKKNETLGRLRLNGSKDGPASDTHCSANRCFRIRDPLHPIARFAGQLAERKFTGRRAPNPCDSDDQRIINEAFHCCWFSSRTTRAYLHYCWHAAEDFVRQGWRDVETVAARLLEMKVLREREVREIVFQRRPASESK